MTSQRRGTILALTGVVLLLAGSVSVWTPEPEPAEPEPAAELDAVYAPPVEKVETRVMARGQTLGGLLAGTDVTGNEMASFLLTLREYMNPRRLMPGVEVTLRQRMTDGATRSVAVQMNADSVVHLTRGDLGWTAELRLTPVHRDTVVVTGEIGPGESLFQSLVGDESLNIAASERYALVIDLARIYEYKIDFIREIQPGDSYAFVYERDVRPDGTTRWRRILASTVTNRDTDMVAVHYAADGLAPDYFDLNGRSLRLAFSRYPLDYVRVTSSFAWRRYHPVLGRYRAHLGTDFGAGRGTPVKVTGAGTVSFAGRDGGYGNLIRVRHPGGYETRYAHLNGFAKDIRAGTKVQQGQIIGYVGSTGLATGPHLHYEFRQHGKAMDARKVEIPAAPPVPKSQRTRFDALAAERLTLLRETTRSEAPVRLVRQTVGAGAAAP